MCAKPLDPSIRIQIWHRDCYVRVCAFLMIFCHVRREIASCMALWVIMGVKTETASKLDRSIRTKASGRDSNPNLPVKEGFYLCVARVQSVVPNDLHELTLIYSAIVSLC